jgi:hypothetical protein
MQAPAKGSSVTDAMIGSSGYLMSYFTFPQLIVCRLLALWPFEAILASGKLQRRG